MSSCLLISANQVVVPYPVYPLGVAHLLGVLRDDGHEARHFDLLSHGGLAALEQLLTSTRFDLVGVSIRNLDTVDSNNPQGLLADILPCLELIRRSTKAPLVLGGPGFSIMPAVLLDLFAADYGVVGEGEKILSWLAAELAQGRPPAQRLFHGGQDAFQWPRPRYEQEACDYYTRHGGMLNIQTKRGCPMKCTYCSYPTIEGTRLRSRDPDEVADDVDRLTRKHGARYIFFTDSVFNDHGGHFRLVAEALIKKGNTTPWCAYFRPQNIKAADLRLLKRAGLQALEMGTDAATDTTLAALNKGFTFAEAVEANGLAVAAGLSCAHFIMFGGPDESPATLAEGLANLEQLAGSVIFAFTGIRILPGTALRERAIMDGLITEQENLVEPVFYYSPQVRRQEIDEALRAAFARRQEWVYPCEEAEARVRMLHSMGHDGPLWDLLLGRGLRRGKGPLDASMPL
ncbi:MAG: lipid biosynthesis B12-binding/radical SAM protein [Desulfurivibrionaceae bacterium]|nr:lipid biosynthesis B12-binding/radical SAM protein [Desulfurivibrionaceae bacterium]